MAEEQRYLLVFEIKFYILLYTGYKKKNLQVLHFLYFFEEDLIEIS